MNWTNVGSKLETQDDAPLVDFSSTIGLLQIMKLDHNFKQVSFLLPFKLLISDVNK